MRPYILISLPVMTYRLPVESAASLALKARQFLHTFIEQHFEPNDVGIVVSAGRAYIFYFTHQRGADAQGKDPDWNKRTVIQVAELQEAGGIITCDRNQPVHLALRPPTRP